MPASFIRVPALALALTLACFVAAYADPAVRVDLLGGQARVELVGSYAGSRYTVYRGDAGAVALARISEADALCTGDCFVFDAGAQLGGTYQYRFDVLAAGGTLTSYGPYSVTIGSPVAGFRVAALASPFRGRGVLRVSAGSAGASRAAGLAGRVSLHDVNGRLVRELYRGTLSQLTFDVAWDGRDGTGALAPPGLYLARFEAGPHVSSAKVILTR